MIDDGLFDAASFDENVKNKRFSEMHFVAQATSSVLIVNSLMTRLVFKGVDLQAFNTTSTLS